jgi:hypothetical protein
MIRSNTYILVLAGVFALCGCSQNANMDLEEKQMHKYGVVDSQGNHIPSNPEREKEFQKFWIIFRNAIISNDWNAIISNTHFPLETRGSLDDDPVIKIEKDRFRQVFEIFLQTAYSFPPIKTQYDKIKNKENVYPYITDDWYRLGNMQFKKIKGKWFLTFIYIEPDLIESKIR